MASVFHTPNPTPRNRSRLLAVLGWTALAHGCVLALLYGFAVSFGVL